MNIVNKLTLRHLKENKGRTVVTTMGIIVSVAMITAVLVAMTSFFSLFGDIAAYTDGNYVFRISDATQQEIESVKNDSRVSDIGFGADGSGYRIKERKSNAKGIGTVYLCDDEEYKMLVTAKYDGTLPQNENEIAVEEKLITKNNLSWKIGDTVTLEVGQRISTATDSDGNSISYEPTGKYETGEKFEGATEKQFKITAILHNNVPTSQYGIVSKLTDTKNAKALLMHANLKTLNTKSFATAKDICEKACGDDRNYAINSDLLNSYLSFGKNSTAKTLLPLVAIVLVIILIASVVLIYNAFAMSLSEKVRYLGMLASVGATKKQKRLSVYFEGLILGAIGIPVGILCGIVGIGITLKALGQKIISTGMIAGVGEGVSMRVTVRPVIIVLIVLISAITIFVSLLIPSKKASAITPIEALRQTGEIKIKSKRLKSPKIVRKVFGYEGEIAHKNLKRNGRKSRIITVSIALSVILFLSCNYFCDMFTRSVNIESSVPYQVTMYYKHEDKEIAKNMIESVSDVNDYYSVFNYTDYIMPSNDLFKGFASADNVNSSYRKLYNKGIKVFVNIIDDNMFNSLCKANGIDSSQYYTGGCKGILMNNYSHSSSGGKIFTNDIIGKPFYRELYDDDGNIDEKVKITVCDTIDFNSKNTACNLNPANSVSVFIPDSNYFSSIGKNYADNAFCSYGIVTDNHEKVAEQLNELSESPENKMSYCSINDLVDSLEVMNTVILIIQVFVYGFIALITLITVFNIINTISTGVQSRRKEFAMLKSVGTTPKGFNKIVMLESAFYGIKALVFALPISVVISLIMNKAIGEDSLPFTMNWQLYFIVILAVFVIIGATMLYSVKSLRKDNIIETLKEDIN